MIPGRILVVDNVKGEVDDLMAQFMKRGEHAVYSGLPVEDLYHEDTRLLILDYWLFEDDEPNSLSTIAEIINSAFQKSKFFLIVIWSAKVTGSNRAEYQRNIEQKYKERYDLPLPCILLKPIGRDELNYTQLIAKIETEIANYPELNLLYEVEKIIDGARDKVGTQIYGIGNWSSLIEELSREYDEESVERLLLVMYLNMLKRNTLATEEFKQCIRRIKAELDSRGIGSFNELDFGRIYSAQYYYGVSKREQIGAGDVLYKKKSGKYYMVVTPECDITNDKHTAIRLIESMKVDHDKLGKDLTYIQELAKTFSLTESDGSTKPLKVIDALMRGQGLRTNYYTLLFLRDNGNFYHLVFDFHKTKFVKKTRKVSELGDYSRVCRVDSPLLNAFIQQYASHCSRFGTMTIPKQMSKSLVSRLTRRPSQRANTR